MNYYGTMDKTRQNFGDAQRQGQQPGRGRRSNSRRRNRSRGRSQSGTRGKSIDRKQAGLPLSLEAVASVDSDGSVAVAKRFTTEGKPVAFTSLEANLAVVGRPGILRIKFELPQGVKPYDSILVNSRGHVFDDLTGLQSFLDGLVDLEDLFRIESEIVPPCPRRKDLAAKGLKASVTAKVVDDSRTHEEDKPRKDDQPVTFKEVQKDATKPTIGKTATG